MPCSSLQHHQPLQHRWENFKRYPLHPSDLPCQMPSLVSAG